MTDEELARQDAEHDALYEAPAEWDKYKGNNHHRIAPPPFTRGGTVHFGAHIGKPLSQRLWQDLRFRLVMTGLCVYGPNASEWTIGWFAGHVCVRLDEAGNVTDIDYAPHAPWLAAADASAKAVEFTARERLGKVYGHVAGL